MTWVKGFWFAVGSATFANGLMTMLNASREDALFVGLGICCICIGLAWGSRANA